VRVADVALAQARQFGHRLSIIEAEVAASAWLGHAWAGTDQQGDEAALCAAIASGPPGPGRLEAVCALARVAVPWLVPDLSEQVERLRQGSDLPPWATAPPFETTAAWRAVDPWDDEQFCLLRLEARDLAPVALYARISQAGGTYVWTLAVLPEQAIEILAEEFGSADPPMPLIEADVAETLRELAHALARTDILVPPNDDPEYADFRAFAWARCHAFLPPPPTFDQFEAERADSLLEEFLAELPEAEPSESVRFIAERAHTYGQDYMHVPHAWSPTWVALFLGDWLPRKTHLDADDRAALTETLRRWLRFALNRRGVNPQWIGRVVDAVDENLDEYTAAVDTPPHARELAAELERRGIDVGDPDAVARVASEINARFLALRVRRARR
jgi:hypothetical protein